MNWETASEKNNHYFTIEKTIDLISFETVAEVKGAGDSDSPTKYSTIDFQPYQGTSYYRLKQTDYDGKFVYSDFVVVTSNSTSNFSFNVFPNPGSTEAIHYSISGSKGQEKAITLNDITGREVYSSVNVIEEVRKTIFPLVPNGKLPAGIYVINAASDNKVISKKLVIQ